MATTMACPSCGTAMREIVWGFGTLADVDDVGDVVIGGCVVDVDTHGRVAVAQCPSCGTRADADGVALERPQPAPVAHPFDVSFSSPPSTKWEVRMPEESSPEQSSPLTATAETGPSAAASAPGTWRDRVEPYSAHEVELPPPSAPAPEHVEPYTSREDPLPDGGADWPEQVEPYTSREDPLPDGGAVWPDRVEPYTSRGDDAPPASAPHRDAIDPYASREDPLPESGNGWRERIAPFAGGGSAAEEPAESAPGDLEAAPDDLDPARVGGSDGEGPARSTAGSDAEGPAVSLDGEPLDDQQLDGSDFSEAQGDSRSSSHYDDW